jgi:hypothetical protein
MRFYSGVHFKLKRCSQQAKKIAYKERNPGALSHKPTTGK